MRGRLGGAGADQGWAGRPPPWAVRFYRRVGDGRPGFSGPPRVTWALKLYRRFDGEPLS